MSPNRQVSGSESAVHGFTIKSLAAPTISNVSASGTQVPDGGTTDETSLNVWGSAQAGLQVELFDGTTSILTTASNTLGNWKVDNIDFAVGPHALKARALYGDNKESAVRRFTVVPLAAPTISSVKDVDHHEIPPYGNTNFWTLYLTGAANIGRQVEVFDGTTSVGEATADASGQWSKTLIGVETGIHAIKARALYGNGEESASYWFSAHGAPTVVLSKITRPDGTNVPPWATISSRSVTVTGLAPTGLEVEVFDGTTSKGKATANTSQEWNLAIDDLAVGPHPLKAKLLFGDGIESAVFQFTVR